MLCQVRYEFKSFEKVVVPELNLVSLISMCFYDDHDMFFLCKICLSSTEERDSENPKQRGSFLLFLFVFMFLMTIRSLKSTRSTWRFLFFVNNN
jgi:succinate-acetate transporter protein